MPQKEIQIFDTSNSPLRVTGIHVELFDATTYTRLSGAESDDLNLGKGNQPFAEWGVRLRFDSVDRPLHVYVKDPKYHYPGNVVHNLNGRVEDRIHIDLLQLPGKPGGQSKAMGSGNPGGVSAWIESSTEWSSEDKRAVRQLIFNYGIIIGPLISDFERCSHVRKIAYKWEEAMVKP